MSAILSAAYHRLAFQTLAQDPDPVVGANVDFADHLFQHTDTAAQLNPIHVFFHLLTCPSRRLRLRIGLEPGCTRNLNLLGCLFVHLDAQAWLVGQCDVALVDVAAFSVF